MPQNLRVNFLNWQPDKEDFGNEGLAVCTNAVHDSEGWKPIHLASAGAFATTGSLAASAATILSIVAKSVGTQGDKLCAWITDGVTPGLRVGVNGVTAGTNVTGYPLSFATLGTSHEIYAFDVAETPESHTGVPMIFFTVEARQTLADTSTVTLRHAGYLFDPVI